MFSIRALVLAGVCLAAPSLFAHSDLPQRFSNVSKDVVSRVLKIESCQFQPSAPKDVVRWILRNREALANDVSKSRHEWLTGQASCAHTKAEPMATIYFSYAGCDAIGSSTADISRVIVEQSVYHLGIVDDGFAKSVARAFTSAASSCEPSSVSDPFGPRFCASAPVTEKEALAWLDLPTKFKANIGEVKMATRGRRCYDVGGCQPWMGLEKWTADVPFVFDIDSVRASGGYSFASYLLNWKAALQVELVSNKPVFTFNASTGSSVPFSYYDSYSKSQRTVYVSGVSLSNIAIAGEPLTGVKVWGYTVNGSTGRHLPLGLNGRKELSFAGNLGRDCLWLSQTSDYRASDTAGNSYTFESQMVFYSKF